MEVLPCCSAAGFSKREFSVCFGALPNKELESVGAACGAGVGAGAADCSAAFGGCGKLEKRPFGAL